jgi:hypothetical protein
MSRIALASIVGLIAVTATTPASAETTQIVATVGPGSTISLKTMAGKTITTLRAGSYTIRVRDRSARRGFHLLGENGIRRSTGGSFVGRVNWTLKLTKGNYWYFSGAFSSKAGRKLRVV